ncbi:MAG TPA: diaminopimelate epimerase [Eubacteriaceae bacterium]|nr:diaminopimelate epimerase [Eubacteriaceae bacterium]
MEFKKYHGTGNDFIIVDNRSKAYQLAEKQIADLCDRHFGIGADGMMFVEESEKADVKMVYHNADGSPAAMCGNGIRCFAKFTYDYGIVKEKVFTIETKAGIKRIRVEAESGEVHLVEVNMGKAVFEADQVPVYSEQKEWIDQPVETPYGTFRLSAASMGNPHCVIVVDEFQHAQYEKIGPYFEKASIFPNGANVNFVEYLDRSTIKVTTWEKGSGFTLACGTGSCASVAVLNRMGLLDESVKVVVPGGELSIQLNDEVIMSGPAVHVFDGKIIATEEESS